MGVINDLLRMVADAATEPEREEAGWIDWMAVRAFWGRVFRGNTPAHAVRVCQGCVDAGCEALHAGRPARAPGKIVGPGGKCPRCGSEPE